MAPPTRGVVAFSTTAGWVPPLDRTGVEVRIAKPGDQCQPRSHLKPVADEYFAQAAGYRSRRRADVLAVGAQSVNTLLKPLLWRCANP